MSSKKTFNPYRELVAGITPTEFEKYCLDVLAGYAEKEQLTNFEIMHNTKQKAADGLYQIDIFAKFIAMGAEYRTIIECKMHSNSIKREIVVVLADKVKSLGAHKGILISTSGFQRGAYDYAKEHGIALWQIMDREVLHILNAATPETKEQERRLFLMVELQRRMPKYYAMAYTDYDFPSERIFPTDKAVEKIREQFKKDYKLQ
ncbi:MAG: restriction endonuclease [Bacteroidales bacterium]|nr:restriction endonuclease [Bacteroidales bacterium]